MDRDSRLVLEAGRPVEGEAPEDPTTRVLVRWQ